MIRNHIVEITPIENNSGLDDNSDIGMFGGKLRWCTGYDDFETPLTCSIGFLSDNWISTLTKSATVARSGNYASTGGGTLNIITTSKFFNWLTEYNVSIKNALVTVLESRDGGVTYYPITTGMVSQDTDAIKGGKIPFADPTKSTATTLTKEIKDSGKFYPVNFGRLSNAKTVSVKDDNYVQPWITKDGDDELKAVWNVFSSSSIDCDLFMPYSTETGVTNADVNNFINSITESIDRGGVAIKQGDNYYPISSVITRPVVGFVDGIKVLFAESNTKDGSGITNSNPEGFEDVDLYASFVAWGQTSYNDFFEGENASDTLSNYGEDNEEFLPLPFVRTNEEVSFPAVEITDADSAGWDLIPMTCTASSGKGWTNGTTVSLDPDGLNSNITDGNESSGLQVNTKASLGPYYSQFSLFTTLDVQPVEKPDGDTVLAVYSSGQVGSLFPSAIFTRWWGTVIDKFGNTYPIGTFEEPIFEDQPPKNTGNYYFTDNCCFAYTDSDNREKWDYQAPSGTVSSLAGVQMSVDLSDIPDMVWETGFTLNLTFNTYEFSGDEQIHNAYLMIREVQILKKSDFKADEVYTDVQGRKDQDTTSISTLAGVYEHCLKMQNFSNRGVPVPADGWGLQYPSVSDWTSYYNELDLSVASLGTAAFQIMSSADARTDKIKAEICRLSWAIGYTDNNGIERLKSMNDGLHNTDGVLIKYGDLFKKEVPIPKDRKISDVFINASFDYLYNTATEEASENVTVDYTGTDFVSSLAKILFDAYNVINKTPQILQNCKWINDLTASGINLYIEGFYKWQGVIAGIAKKRYSVPIKLPYDFAVDNNLDIASSILLEIPNMTYFNGTPLTHSGIITSITRDIYSSKPSVSIMAEMVGQALPKKISLLYIETGSAATEIHPTGSQTTEIIEGL